ncbi:FlxA-like family protein, partial [Escherichia coli]|uniref:FlxA-like family protein n=1 Tax=Escherichia coli TaxID=562 RepID=UPI003C6D128F
MSVTIQGNTSTVISNNSAPEGTSEIAKITRQIQVLTEKLGKISSEEGMTTQQKKEMAALVQKQIESLWAQLEQLLRQQAEKKNEDATVQPDKKEEKKSLYIDLCNCLILICSIQHQMKVNLW